MDDTHESLGPLREARSAGKHEEVLRLSGDVLRACPDNWEALLARANALLVAGPPSEDEAYRMLEAAFGRSEPDVDSWVVMAAIEDLAGYHERAEQHLRAVLRRSPDHYDALRSLAILRLSPGTSVSVEEERAVLEKAIVVAPRRWEAYAQLAQLQRSAGERLAARANYEGALSRIADSAPEMKAALEAELRTVR